MFSSCKNEFQVKGWKTEPCRSMIYSCRGMCKNLKTHSFSRELHAAAWILHAAACHPRTKRSLCFMPQHASFMPRHDPDFWKNKTHELSLSFTLLNPTLSLKHLQIFPNFKPFYPSQCSSHQIPNCSYPSQYQQVFNLLLQDWRFIEEVEKVEILKKPQQFKSQVSFDLLLFCELYLIIVLINTLGRHWKCTYIRSLFMNVLECQVFD